MHLSIALLFALGSASHAAPATNHLQARDAKTVMTALDMVTKSVNGLDKSVKALDSPTNAAALANIATSGQMVGDTVKKAQKMVEGTGAISIFSAIQVMQSANALTDSLTTTTSDLVKKKPIVDQAGLSPVVSMMLVMQKDASGGFSAAVTDKVPALAKSIAMGSANKVNDALDSAIKAYMAPAAKPAAPPAAPPADPPATPAATPAPLAAGNGTADAGPAAAGVNAGNSTSLADGSAGNSTMDASAMVKARSIVRLSV